MRSDLNKIKDKISRTKRRYYLVNYSDSFAKILFLTVALFALFFVLTPFLFKYAAYRSAFIAVAIAAAVFVLSKYFLPLVIGRKKDDFFAILLEKVSPDINNLIINAHQLGGLSDENVKKYGFSESFINLTIDEASRKVDMVSPALAVSAHGMKKDLMVSLLLSLIVVTAFFSNPDFFKNTFAKFMHPDRFIGDGLAKTLEEVERERLNLPEIGDFIITYDYPDYSKLEDEVFTGTNGDIECLKGSHVTVRAKSDRPLSGASFVLNNSQRITATVQNGSDLSYDFMALESGLYHLEFEGIEYPNGFEHKLYQVIIKEDDFPNIKLVEPKEDLTVEEKDEIQISYEADDDFGVTQVNLIIEREAGTEKINVFKTVDNVKETSGKYSYNLSVLKLNPGEVIKVYLETYDNDTISGPKKSVSNERYLDVYSKEKRRREIAQMKERLFETFIDLLGDHIEKSLVKTNFESTEEIRVNQIKINSKTKDIITLLDEILTAIKEEEIEDDLSYIPLNNMKLNLQDFFDKKEVILKNMASDSYSSIAADTAVLKEMKEAEILEAEKDIIFLDNENKKARMDDILSDSEQMLEAQKSLIDMLEELKESGDMEGAKEKLKDVLKQIEELSQNIMDKLAKFPQSLPDEFVNSDSMKELDMKKDQDMMEKLKESLKKNDIEEALKLATEMLNSMNKMMSSFENSASEFAQQESKDIMQELDEAINKLDEMQNKQQELMQDTKKINESAKKRRVDEQNKKIGDFIRKQQDLISEIRKEMAAIQQELLTNPPKESDKQPQQPPQNSIHGNFVPQLQQNENDEEMKKLRSALDKLNEIPRMLMQDFNQAEKLAEDVLEKTKEMREGFEKEGFKERMKRPKSLDRAKDKAASAQEKEEKLLDKFNEFKESSDDYLTEEEKKDLKKMAGDQKDLKDGLKQFQNGLDKKSKDIPMMSGKGLKGKLDGAGMKMEDAQGKLEGGKASGSIPSQGEAASKLGSAKSELQQMKEKIEQMQASGSPGAPMPGGMQMPQNMPQGGQPDVDRKHSERGRGTNVDDVNIPTAEEYKVPKEFREDILKGMKEKFPKDYEDKVKKYYEELIK